MNPQSFDHLAEEYDSAASLERSSAFFLDHLPLRRRSVLDVGCGAGILASELSRHFKSVLAIDISEPMLAIARGKRAAANVEYRRADANHIELDRTFDAIVSHTTFHHLEDIPEPLTRLKAALAPGGCLILIDLINRWPKIARRLSAFYVAAACAAFPWDIFRHGSHGALCLLRFRVSRPWVDHLKNDRYFSRAEFREIYGRNLPGASFTRLRYFMGVVWQSPTGASEQDGSA